MWTPRKAKRCTRFQSGQGRWVCRWRSARRTINQWSLADLREAFSFGPLDPFPTAQCSCESGLADEHQSSTRVQSNAYLFGAFCLLRCRFGFWRYRLDLFLSRFGYFGRLGLFRIHFALDASCRRWAMLIGLATPIFFAKRFLVLCLFLLRCLVNFAVVSSWK